MFFLLLKTFEFLNLIWQMIVSSFHMTNMPTNLNAQYQIRTIIYNLLTLQLKFCSIFNIL